MASLQKDERTGIYYLNVKLKNGKWRNHSLHTKDYAEAKQVLKQEQAREYDGRTSFFDRPKEILINEHIDTYLSGYCKANHSPRTLELETGALSKFKEFCQIKQAQNLSEISPDLLEGYKVWRREQKISASNINRHLTIIYAMITKAVSDEVLWSNPLKDRAGKNRVSRLKEERREILPLTKEDVKKLSDSADGLWKAIIIVTYLSGMRKSEVIFLKWSSIDFERRKIRVVNHEAFTTKTRKPRIIDTHPLAHEILCRMFPQRKGEYVFSRDGQPIASRLFSDEFDAIRKRAELKCNFHWLRHSFASNLNQNNESVQKIQVLLGHSKITTTELYLRNFRNDLQEAVGRIDVKGLEFSPEVAVS